MVGASYAGEVGAKAKAHAEFEAQLAEMAGPLGPFSKQEDFPKSYFLIPKNLPFMVGLTTFHPMSEKLKLSD